MAYLGKQPALQSNEFREEFNITSTTSTIATSGFVVSGKSNYLDVYKNGVLLGSDDYTLGADRKTITLASNAIAGDIIVVIGRRNLTQGVRFSERRHEHTIANNETTVTFPYPLTGDSTDVYLNGVKLASSDFSINVSTKVISFTVNPVNGDVIAIVSREPATSSSTVLPIVDSNGGSVISESNGSVVVNAGTANIGNNALVVNSSGNVGIGTSSPSNKLTIQDGSNAKIRFNYSDGNEKAFCDFESSGFTFQLGTVGSDALLLKTNNLERIRIDSSGYVGIGTSSISERLEVNGRVKLLASSAPTWDTNTRFWMESGFGTRYDGYQHRFDVGNSRAEAMRIDTSGNVKMYSNLRIDRGSTADYPLHLVSSGRYCTIGALNSTYVHIDTDSSSGIYFYDSISVASLDNRSDEVLKTDINTISDALSKVLAIRGVSFEWEVDKYPELKLKSGTNFGVIAQECESLHPEFVKESLHPTDENTSFKSLNYLELIPFLIEATKEQQALIESQQSQIDALTARIEALETGN